MPAFFVSLQKMLAFFIVMLMVNPVIYCSYFRFYNFLTTKNTKTRS